MHQIVLAGDSLNFLQLCDWTQNSFMGIFIYDHFHIDIKACNLS